MRGPRRPDLAARVRGRARTLRAQLDPREALADASRQANASLEPARIASWLVTEALGCFDAACWVVTALDPQAHRHQAGSRAALTEAARIIRGCARETDVVARFGGDEFSLILPDTSQEGALFVATRIRERLRSPQFLTSGGPSIRLTTSIGVATLPDAAASVEELLKAADTAMYKGRDGIYLATVS